MKQKDSTSYQLISEAHHPTYVEIWFLFREVAPRGGAMGRRGDFRPPPPRSPRRLGVGSAPAHPPVPKAPGEPEMAVLKGISLGGGACFGRHPIAQDTSPSALGVAKTKCGC